MDNTESNTANGTKNTNESSSESNRNSLYRYERLALVLVSIAATLVILALVKAASSLIAPVLLALFLAIMLLIPLHWLDKKGCPRAVSYVIVIGYSLIFVIGLGWFIISPLTSFVADIPQYRKTFVKKYSEISKNLQSNGFTLDWFETGKEERKHEPKQEEISTPQPVPEKETPPAIVQDEKDEPDAAEQETEKTDTVEEKLDRINQLAKEQNREKDLVKLDPTILWDWIGALALRALNLLHLLEQAFVVLLVTIFILMEAAQFPAKVDKAFGENAPFNNKHLHRIAHGIREYLVLKTFSNLLSAISALSVYFLFGVPHPFFWAIIAFFLYYIPNIGGTLASIIPGILILMLSPNPVVSLLLYIVCLLVIECVIGYGIEPRMMGHSFGLSKLIIILSLLLWGYILGAVGLFLAVPLTVMMKIVLQAFPETEWIAVMLDDSGEIKRTA